MFLLMHIINANCIVLYQSIVSECCCRPLPHIFDISWSTDQFEKTGLENLEQLLYLYTFRFWILNYDI